jgi:hypothetical protein
MPLIYHFTDIENLPSILEAGAVRCHRDAPTAVEIGNQDIKNNRQTVEVTCGPGGKVCDYVPFYYAPRSPMLSAIMNGRVEGVSTDQSRLVYLVASTEAAYANGLQCVFTDGNAGTFHITKFEDDAEKLSAHVDWPLMEAKLWFNTDEDPDRRRRRMAEFLIHESAPLEIFKGIAVLNSTVEATVTAMVRKAGRSLPVVCRPGWYF